MENLYPNIILASSSPRRKELLQGLGIPFTIHASDADEQVPPATPPSEMVEMLAVRKAHSVAEQYAHGLVIGSDTIVVLGNRILGKPANDEEAYHMLSALQGKEHTVYSGIAVIDAGTGKSIVSHQKTKVRMGAMRSEKIWQYIATGEPRDKAGAYAIQGYGATLIEGITGDYFTVVGLPLRLLAEILQKFGMDVLKKS